MEEKQRSVHRLASHSAGGSYFTGAPTAAGRSERYPEFAECCRCDATPSPKAHRSWLTTERYLELIKC
jgi:hypothetical protein